MSTNDVLSEGELDALMDSVSSGDVPLDDAAGDAQWGSFDFSTREQAMLAQMPTLKTINEKHALGLALGIQELFRIPVEVTPREVRLLPLGEALMAIPEPAVINLIKTDPLQGISFVINPGELLSFFIDQYFGGAAEGSSARPSSLELTPTERRINELLATRFLLTLQSAWSEQVAMTTKLTSTETNPDFLQLDSPAQLALSFSFDIKVFEWSAAIEWLLPYTALEPLRDKLSGPVAKAEPAPANSDWEANLRAELPDVALELSAVFSSRSVNIAEVLGLRAGSIVPLKVPSEVTLCAEDQPLGCGEHGAFNGKKAVKLTRLSTPRKGKY